MEQQASSWASGSLWLIVVFVGAFALIGALMWARARNATITPEQKRRSEDATRDLYEAGSPDDTPTTRH